MFDLVIRGGRVVTSQGTVNEDIGIEGEHVAAIGAELSAGRVEIDASGFTVLPGTIDVHLHFNEPGRTEWEGAASGSRALAAGGGTLFFDMPLNSSPCTVGAREFDEKRAALEAASITDFGLWGGIVPGHREELAGLAERGVIGYKAFLCDSGLPEFPRADDLTLYEGMREAARFGLPVAVHAESEEITKSLTRRMIEQGRNDIGGFLESRPVIAEVEAIHRAGVLAREAGCKLHIVHVSSGRGVAAALEERARGADISIETCPHYLLFTEEDVLRTGAVAKCAPPLRSQAERDALWAAVMRGEIDIIASDHSPCLPEMKRRDSFFAVWGGIAGAQWTLPAMIDRGHYMHGLAVERIAGLCAGAGARRFDITKKGAIETGRHADLAIVDLSAAKNVSAEAMFQRHHTTPYLGLTLRGVVQTTIRRGEVIYSGGSITARTRGRLVRPEKRKDRHAAFGTYSQQLSV